MRSTLAPFHASMMLLLIPFVLGSGTLSAQGGFLAFVDMESVVEKHPAAKKATERLRSEMATRLEALRQEADKMRTLRDDLDLYAENSPERLEQLRRIRVLEATLDLDRKMLKIEFDLKLASEIVKVYEQACAAVEAVARKRGIQVVAMYSNRRVEGKSQREVVGDILTRPFVYHDKRLDITDQVLKRLGVVSAPGEKTGEPGKSGKGQDKDKDKAAKKGS